MYPERLSNYLLSKLIRRAVPGAVEPVAVVVAAMVTATSNCRGISRLPSTTAPAGIALTKVGTVVPTVTSPLAKSKNWT